MPRNSQSPGERLSYMEGKLDILLERIEDIHTAYMSLEKRCSENEKEIQSTKTKIVSWWVAAALLVVTLSGIGGLIGKDVFNYLENIDEVVTQHQNEWKSTIKHRGTHESLSLGSSNGGQTQSRMAVDLGVSADKKP